MPFVPDFIRVQLSNLTSVVITDTSTGSDGSIASRRVYFETYNGGFVVPTGTTTDYVSFPLSSGASIQIDNLLYRDYGLNVRVDWLDVSNVAIYTKTIPSGFGGYAKYFLYQLTQYQISNKKLLYQRNFRESKLDCWQSVLSADNAITYAGDLTNAQACYDDAKYYIDHPELFY